MEMTDQEIIRKYNRAETPYDKRKQIRVLAELNGVSVEQMREHIQSLEAPKAAVKKRGPKKKKAAGVVVEAVKLRLEEVEHCMNDLKVELDELTEKNNAYLEEWGVLMEWVKEND